MAKVNASVELASMHIYLMILGFTPTEMVDIMTSPVVEDVISKMKDDIFTKNSTSIVPFVITDLKQNEYKGNPEKLKDLEAFETIYSGAQEVKKLAKLLGVNQKTSANIQEINKFLTNFESIIFAREHEYFGNDIKSYKENIASNNGIDKKESNPVQYNKNLDKMIAVIIKNSKGRFSKNDYFEIKRILENARNIKIEFINNSGDITTRNVSVLGGDFDFRYYIHPTNEAYRQATKEYYNLIKDTFNIFDIIDTVPHFKEMIGGLIKSHQLLTLSSFKYNAAFNLLKDAVKKYGVNLKNDNNPNVKYVNGNNGFPIKIEESNIIGASNYVDRMMILKWLKYDKFGQSVVFNKEQISKYMNLAGVTDFSVYTNPEDYENSKAIKTSISDLDDSFTINLNSPLGIANFKRFMEDVLLGVLSNHGGSDLDDLLKIGRVANVFGIEGTTIMPSFKITNKNIPATAEKIFKLERAFNDLDFNTKKELQLESGMNWRHLFFIYNLLVNNEKYGDHRLTPLLENYVKENNSAANAYIKFCYKLDSGEIDLFEPDTSLINPTKIINGQTFDKTEDEINQEAEELRNRDLLFYAYGKRGTLGYSGKKSMQVVNPDFVLVQGIESNVLVKQYNERLNILRDLLNKNNFLIEFKCE